jgi:hypothetical protein
MNNELQYNGLYEAQVVNLRQMGDLVYNIEKRKEVLGVTKYLGVFKGNKADVFLFKAAFVSKRQLFLTMGHEYIHVAQVYAGLPRSFLREHYAYKWEYEYFMKINGWRDYNPWKYYLLPIQEDLRFNIKAW